jgi:enoyl-[acyl-carrier protein] reductase / trans-2-enoyl-CoA reductase (NAD+)
MAVSVVQPKGKGALLLDAHPGGCEATVEQTAAEITTGAAPNDPTPTVLIIGTSSGYGQAITTAGLVGMRISGIGLCLERAATGRRTASAGWYRARATAALAQRHGAQFELHNGDCYATDTKHTILRRLAEKHGKIDYLIYSVAAPRRTDPSGTTYQSVIKPIGAAHTTSSLDLDAGGRAIKQVEVQPANQVEIDATVKVMGGEDWAEWIDALNAHDLLAPGFTTVALSYIGSALTAPIYRHGTIGRAKDHLEATARQLTETTLKKHQGQAVTSVNGAAVTQASTAIPGISLYICMLRRVLGNAMQSPVTQAARLWHHLRGQQALAIDDQGRIRLDDWEFADAVQPQLHAHWQHAVNTAEVSETDARWFVDEVHRLYGFNVNGVDYSQPQEIDLPWPTTP